MNAIQIIALLFVLWMTYFSFLHYRRHEFSIWEFSFWQIIWLGLATIVLFPGPTKLVIEKLHFSRAFDLLTAGGILILFGVTFRNYVLLRRTEHQLEEFIRREALRRSDHPQ